MRGMRSFAISAALLVATSTPVLADDLGELMALLAQRSHGHVNFEEEDHLALLDHPLHSSGELLYERPDHLEKRTLAPRAASMVLQGGTVTLESRGKKRVLPLRDYPQLAPFIESMRATLAGDRIALERSFQVTFDGSLEHWTLTLAPLDPKLKALVQKIRIAGTRAELRSLSVSQADGDTSEMTIGSSLPP
jgi:outer membrane lipoprotein-sorting protein